MKKMFGNIIFTLSVLFDWHRSLFLFVRPTLTFIFKVKHCLSVQHFLYFDPDSYDLV